MVRDIPCNYAASADYAAVSDGYARAHHNIGTEPAVIPNDNRFCVAEKALFTIFTDDSEPLFGKHGVERSNQCDIGTKIAVITDGHLGVILYGEIKVHKACLTDGGMAAIMKTDGA